MKPGRVVLVVLLAACGRTELLGLATLATGGDRGLAGSAGADAGGRSGSGGAPGMGGTTLDGSGGQSTYTITEFPIPTPGADARRITWSNGYLWFTECTPNQIGRMSPTGEMTEFALPSAPGERHCPQGMSASPDQNLWYTDTEAGVIAYLTPDGISTEVAVLAASSPQALYLVGGDSFWFTGYAGHLGSLSWAGEITSHFAGYQGTWQELVSDRDDDVWVTGFASDVIGRCTRQDECTIIPMPSGGNYPYGITVVSDGNIWFTEAAGNRIGRITPDGTITEFPLPTQNSGPRIITVGPDNALWFTEYLANKIGRITTKGEISEIPVPTPFSYPCGITSVSHDIWFTEEIGNNIGRIRL
jgi:streptogramin lyase